jgi:hypothetical protein
MREPQRGERFIQFNLSMEKRKRHQESSLWAAHGGTEKSSRGPESSQTHKSSKFYVFTIKLCGIYLIICEAIFCLNV